MGLKSIAKFEEQNGVGVNVLGWEAAELEELENGRIKKSPGDGFFPLYPTKVIDKPIVNLLLYGSDVTNTQHYVAITGWEGGYFVLELTWI